MKYYEIWTEMSFKGTSRNKNTRQLESRRKGRFLRLRDLRNQVWILPLDWIFQRLSLIMSKGKVRRFREGQQGSHIIILNELKSKSHFENIKMNRFLKFPK